MTATSHIHIPPEWGPQTAVWVGWPTLPSEWGDAFHPARGEITTFVRALSAFVPVHIAAGSEEAAASAETQCGSFATIHHVPLGDIWLRDTGPIFSIDEKRQIANCFRFDGWGGKFVMPGDTDINRAMAETLKLPLKEHGFVLEGGAVEMDGAGTLITTRQCLLDGVRNPDWNEVSAERVIKNSLGVSNITWLEQGLLNDHTDGHVDNIARFVGPGRVICQRPSGDDDPHAQVLKDIEAELRASSLSVDTIPSPGRIEIEGEIAPASHLNFLITNGAVMLPVFEEQYAFAAAEAITKLFPNRQIIPLPARNILAGGGTFHCMTREVPAPLTGRNNQMSRSLTIAVLQAAFGEDIDANHAKVETLARDAAKQGAALILAPELFSAPYFCKTQEEEHFSRAYPWAGHPAVKHFQQVCKSLGVTMPISIFERQAPHYYNSLVWIGPDGEPMGLYRKSHIPDGPGYQEKFYFRPGDTGFQVFDLDTARAGAGICWDQWFPECAREMALMGAEVLLYPTAIGAEPQDSNLDTAARWRRAMIGHAVSNVMPVAAANRIGNEEGQVFYGTSFIADHTGEIVAELGREEEGVAVASFDLDIIAQDRAAWGFFRDRREDLY